MCPNSLGNEYAKLSLQAYDSFVLQQDVMSAYKIFSVSYSSLLRDNLKNAQEAWTFIGGNRTLHAGAGLAVIASKLKTFSGVNHIQIERIQPFEDGNSRIGRFLINYELIHNNTLPIVIPEEQRTRYFKCIAEQNTDKLSIFFQDLQHVEKERVKSAFINIADKTFVREFKQCHKTVIGTCWSDSPSES